MTFPFEGEINYPAFLEETMVKMLNLPTPKMGRKPSKLLVKRTPNFKLLANEPINISDAPLLDNKYFIFPSLFSSS